MNRRLGLCLVTIFALSALRCAWAQAPAPNRPLAPAEIILSAFLSCDEVFFSALGLHASALPALKPLQRKANGSTYLAVPSRSEEEGQTLALAPPFTVRGIAFNEYLDEITVLHSRKETVYYWGFTTTMPLASVLPVVQALLPKDRALSADGDTWARIDVLENGVWRNIPNHAALKGMPATRPERALIVQAQEDAGTRVICGLQAAPLPAAQLRKLRPDL